MALDMIAIRIASSLALRVNIFPVFDSVFALAARATSAAAAAGAHDLADPQVEHDGKHGVDSSLVCTRPGMGAAYCGRCPGGSSRTSRTNRFESGRRPLSPGGCDALEFEAEAETRAIRESMPGARDGKLWSSWRWRCFLN